MSSLSAAADTRADGPWGRLADLEHAEVGKDRQIDHRELRVVPMATTTGAVVNDHGGRTGGTLSGAVLLALAVLLRRRPGAARDAAGSEAAVTSLGGHGLGCGDVALAVPAPVDLRDRLCGGAAGTRGAGLSVDAALAEGLGQLGHGSTRTPGAQGPVSMRSTMGRARCAPRTS